MKNDVCTTTAEEQDNALRRIVSGETPFVLLRKEEEPFVRILEGTVVSHEKICDIERLAKQSLNEQLDAQVFSCIPYGQLREKFPEVRESPGIQSLIVLKETRILIHDLMHIFPSQQPVIEGEIVFQPTDEEFERRVERVKEELIGKGMGSSFTISRKAETKFRTYDVDSLLSIFRSVLQKEHGTYFTFALHCPDRDIICASPERHLTVQGGNATMNPISGTLRKFPETVTKEKLIAFLRNEKEIGELFMVLDEEMKQMAQMCGSGGTITGPFLKEMSKVIHTEYILRGKSTSGPLQDLQISMFAPTLTASPVSSGPFALNLLEDEHRGQYGGIFSLYGHDKHGMPMIDSAIAIRFAQVRSDGSVSMQAGATIVRDSISPEESQETRGKLGGMISVLKGDASQSLSLLTLLKDPEIQSILLERNSRLSRYHFNNQEHIDHSVDELKGKTVTIIDNGDDFCHMLRHMIRSMGSEVSVVSYSDFDLSKDASDCIVIGPGPGDPTAMSDEKMSTLKRITKDMIASDRRFLSICLGHQILCHELGMELHKKDQPMQGIQKSVNLFGKEEIVGFYNTYTAKTKNLDSVQQSIDDESGDVYAVRGERFAGFQFHPESILSQDGFCILAESLKSIMRR